MARKTIKDYQLCMEILKDLNGTNALFNAQSICYMLAKDNPKLFLELVIEAIPQLADKYMPEIKQRETEKRNKEIESKAIEIAKYEGKVPAIKYIRSKMGLDLKRAKEKIESLTTEFRKW